MNRLHRWQGVSQTWHDHTVFGFTKPAWATATAANYIFVCRLPDGSCRALYFGETEDLCRRWGEHVTAGLITEAYGLGANELHLYFGAVTRQQRLDVETDLRNAHPTALNRQSAPALNTLAPNPQAPAGALGGLFGLGAAALAARPAPNAFGGLAGPAIPQREAVNAFGGLLPRPQPAAPVNSLLAAVRRDRWPY